MKNTPPDMVKVVGLANTLRILCCSNNIFLQVITSQNKGVCGNFHMNHLHDANFFERKTSSFKNSLNQTTHIISNHIISNEYLSNSCRLIFFLKMSPLFGGRLTPGKKLQKKTLPSFFCVANPGAKQIETSSIYTSMDRLGV